MKNIIILHYFFFDLGKKILNIDYDLTIKVFKENRCKNSTSYYSKSEQKKLFDDLETGFFLYFSVY